MDGVGALGFLIIIGVILLMYVGFYILVCTPLFLFLKKSNIRNAWLAYVPVANMYKQNHYLYDLLKYKAVVNGEVTAEEYKSKRRSSSLIITIAVILVSFATGFIGGLIESTQPQTLEYVYGETSTAMATTPGLQILNLIILLITLAYSVMLYIGMYKMVSKKPELYPKSTLSSVLYTVLTVVTLGISWIVQIFYYSISDKYDYYLNQYLEGIEVAESDGYVEPRDGEVRDFNTGDRTDI